MLLKGNQCRLFIIVFILCGFINLSLFPGEADIAFNYYGHAQHFFLLKDYQQAEKLLNTALEFYPRFSDAYYLLYQITLAKPAALTRGIGYLEKALSLDNWKYPGVTQAKKELAALYFRIKAYVKAETILLDLRRNLLGDAEVEILLSRVLGALSKFQVQRSQLAAALKKYPGEIELYILAAEFFFQEGRPAEALKTIENAIHLFPGNSELLFYKIKYTEDDESRKELIGRYLDRNGSRPEIAITALQLDIQKGREYIDFFVTNGGNHYLDLVQELLSVIESREELAHYYISLEADTLAHDETIERILDLNHDGYVEEGHLYTADGISRIRIDNNQDEIIEWELSFRETKPLSLRQLVGKEYVEFTYAAYPHLETVKYSAGELWREYLLVPFAVKYPVISGKQIYHYQLNQSLEPLAEKDLRGLSYSHNIYRQANGVLLRVQELHAGEITREKIDTDEDGVLDHIIEYKQGLPVKAVRDFDNDGVIDATENYSQGKLQNIEFDENNDGVADSLQVFDVPGAILTYWDYNFDGTYDARQQLAGNEVVYEFITGKGKKFDLMVQFKDNKITSISRDDTEIPVTRERGQTIVWIGSQGRIFPGMGGLPAGTYTRNGRKYFIFHHNGNVYIEEVE